jgi:hypothetical protein
MISSPRPLLVLRTFALSALLAVVLLFEGCAFVPPGDPDVDARLKTFTPKPDKALIYVFRNETVPVPVRMKVLIDGKLVGETGPQTYIYAEVDSGNHRLSTDDTEGSGIVFTAVRGRIYYVGQELNPGFRTSLGRFRMVDDKTGQAGVLGSTLTAPAE